MFIGLIIVIKEYKEAPGVLENVDFAYDEASRMQ
jgi:hypothetical protein